MILEWFVAWLQAANKWVEDLLGLIILWVQTLGPVGVFGGVMLETFLAPIPSPIIPMAAGFLLTQGLPLYLQMLIILVDVMFVGAFAATVGAFFSYGIAYFGGYPLIEHYGKYLGTSLEEVKYLRARLEKSSRDEVVLFVTRAVPIIPLSVVSLAAGAIRMDAKKFALVTFFGALPRYLGLGLAGWLVGEAFSTIGRMVDYLENMTLVMLIIFIVVLAVFRLVVRRHAKQSADKPSIQGAKRRTGAVRGTIPASHGLALRRLIARSRQTEFKQKEHFDLPTLQMPAQSHRAFLGLANRRIPSRHANAIALALRDATVHIAWHSDALGQPSRNAILTVGSC